jgi:hypothetical protein
MDDMAKIARPDDEQRSTRGDNAPKKREDDRQRDQQRHRLDLSRIALP